MKEANKTLVRIENAGARKAKKSSTGLAVIFTAVLVIFTCVTIVLLVYFNVGGLGLKTMKILQKNDSVYVAEQTALDDRQASLDKKSAELEDLEKSILKRESDVKKKETELSDRDKALKQSQDEADKLKSDLSAQLNNIQDLVALYTSMDAGKAADLLVRQGNDDMAIKVLKAMKTNDAAEIISNMNPDKAAALMAKMIK